MVIPGVLELGVVGLYTSSKSGFMPPQLMHQRYGCPLGAVALVFVTVDASFPYCRAERRGFPST